MIVPRHSHGICFFDGTIYVAGIKLLFFFYIIKKVVIQMMKMKFALIGVKSMIPIQKDGLKLLQWLIKQLAYL